MAFASAPSSRSLLRIAVIAAGLVALASPAQTQTDTDVVARWAATHAMPLRTVEMAGSMTDLAPLRDRIGEARVVAFGEPLHGGHEPLAFRNRLFRYIVEELGFTAIVLETALTESRRLHEYVLGGPGEVGDLVRESFSWGFGAFQDNVELVQWMRAYNADPSHTRKIRLYGMDVSITLQSKPRRAPLDHALAYMDAADPEIGGPLRARLEPYADRFEGDDLTLTPAEHDALTAALDDLIAAVERSRPDAVARMDREAFDWTHRIAIAARQADRVFRATVAAPAEGAPPDEGPPYSARDAAMAENVRWALDREGPAGRVLVFAHNAHVMNDHLAGGKWDAVARAPETLGRFLRSMFGDDLVLIGTSSALADRDGIELVPDGLDAMLAGVGAPRFLLDLRDARDDPPVEQWLARPRSLRANVSSEQIVTASRAFDLMLFLDRVTRAARQE